MHYLFNDLPCIYFSSSDDGVVVEANITLCRYLGYTSDELVGRKLESIFTLATRIFHQTHFYPLLQMKGHAEEIYITLKAKSGSDVPVLLNAEQKEEEGQIRFHYAGIVVSKRKKFEEEILAAKKAAEQALNENTALKAAQEELQQQAEELDQQLMLAKTHNQELKQLNHLTTHTFQEPLRKLLFFTSQISEADEGTQTGTVAKIRRATADMYTKLKGLQQYVWLTNEEVKWEEVDLRQVTQLAKEQVEGENPGITIMLEAEALPTIEANREQLHFLMKELLSNAVKFRKPGNVVPVKIDASTLLLNKFRQLTEKYKYTEYVKLQVQDDGIGFDGEYGEQAFDLFRKLHLTPTGGGGIGLSLCKKIAENHSGSIALESKKTVGTTVTLFLPLKQEKTK